MKNNIKYNIIDATQGWPIGFAATKEEAVRIYDAAMERDGGRDIAIFDTDGNDVTVDILFLDKDPEESDGIHFYFVFDCAKMANINEEFVESMATFLTFPEARDFAKSMAASTGNRYLVDECRFGADCLSNVINCWYFTKED